MAQQPKRVRRAWKLKFLLAFVVMVFAAIAIDDVLNPRTTPQQIESSVREAEAKAVAQIPRYDWAVATTKSFTLEVAQGMSFGPLPSQYSRIKYNISSSLPISTGLMDPSLRDRQDAWQNLQLVATCYETGILSSEKECPVQNNQQQLVVIKDLRTASGSLIAGMGAALGIKGPAEEATAHNRVTITFYSWQCVENCR